MIVTESQVVLLMHVRTKTKTGRETRSVNIQQAGSMHEIMRMEEMKLIEQIGEEMNRKAAAYSAKLQMRETKITVAAK